MYKKVIILFYMQFMWHIKDYSILGGKKQSTKYFVEDAAFPKCVVKLSQAYFM